MECWHKLLTTNTWKPIIVISAGCTNQILLYKIIKSLLYSLNTGNKREDNLNKVCRNVLNTDVSQAVFISSVMNCDADNL